MRAPKKPGGQPVLSEIEEASFVAHLIAMSFFGFPITTFDLRCIVKAYLDKRGRNVKYFNNNYPGQDWASSFIKRHDKVISQRTSKNISYSRAANNEEIINMFFSNPEKEIEGIPEINI